MLQTVDLQFTVRVTVEPHHKRTLTPALTAKVIANDVGRHFGTHTANGVVLALDADLEVIAINGEVPCE